MSRTPRRSDGGYDDKPLSLGRLRTIRRSLRESEQWLFLNALKPEIAEALVDLDFRDADRAQLSRAGALVDGG